MCCFVCHANRCMRFASAAVHNTGAWIQAQPWFDSSVPSLFLPLPYWGNCFPQEMASLSCLRRCRNRLKLVFCKGDFPNLSIKGGTPLFRSIILRYFPVLRIGKMHLFVRITGDGSRKSGSSNIWSIGGVIIIKNYFQRTQDFGFGQLCLCEEGKRSSSAREYK